MRVLLLLLTVTGCSNADNAEANDVDTGTVPTEDTGSPPVIEEGWASFDGLVEVVDGVATHSTITLGLWEKDPIGEPALSCSVVLEVDAPAAGSAPVDPVQPYVMWRVSTANTTCLGTPDPVTLGIGPLPRELWPAAEFAQVSVRQTRGFYTVWNGDLVVFGLAGTSGQLAGRGVPTSLDPLPDGTYQLVSSYLLEL